MNRLKPEPWKSCLSSDHLPGAFLSIPDICETEVAWGFQAVLSLPYKRWR